MKEKNKKKTIITIVTVQTIRVKKEFMKLIRT